MTSSYTPVAVSQGFGQETVINTNFTAIKTALDSALIRDNTVSNAMAIDLDMGSKKLLNLPKPIEATEAVRLTDLNSLSVIDVVSTLTFSSNITVNVATTTYAILTLTGNTTITFTGGTVEGQVVVVRLKQDATGSRIVTWGTGTRFSTDVPSPTLSTGASITDYLVFRYNLLDTKYDLVAVNRGFS